MPLWARIFLGLFVSYVALVVAREMYFVVTGDYPQLGILGL